MKVRLTALDGALPNLAIMKLAHWNKSKGDEVTKEPNMTQPNPKIKIRWYSHPSWGRNRLCVEDDAYAETYAKEILGDSEDPSKLTYESDHMRQSCFEALPEFEG